MRTKDKARIEKLEKEVATLWKVIDDERLWHPSVIAEIKRRSKTARTSHRQKLLKMSEVF